MPDVHFRSGRSTDDLPGDFGPSQGVGQPLPNSGVEPTEVDKSLDELWEALVSESPANDCLGLGDVVPLSKWDRVTVGIGNKRICGRDEVRLSDAHEFAARNVELLSSRDVRGRVQKSEQHSSRRPRKFVTKRVARALWGREATAVRQELLDL